MRASDLTYHVTKEHSFVPFPFALCTILSSNTKSAHSFFISPLSEYKPCGRVHYKRKTKMQNRRRRTFGFNSSMEKLQQAVSCKSKRTFSLMSLNVLADHLKPQEANLSWQYRIRKIQECIVNYNADVVCLQEVTVEYYHEWFEQWFLDRGFESATQCLYDKSSKLMQDRRMINAIFWRRSKFSLLMSEFRSRIVFVGLKWRDEEEQNAKKREEEEDKCRVLVKNSEEDPQEDHKASETERKYVHITRNSLVVENVDAETQILWIANTHLEGSPELPNLRFKQLKSFFSRLHLAQATVRSNKTSKASWAEQKSEMDNERDAVIVCGDFNDCADSSAHRLMTTGSIVAGSTDIVNGQEIVVSKEDYSCNMHFKSAYVTVSGAEPPFTYYRKHHIASTVDYIFYTPQLLLPCSVLLPSRQQYQSIQKQGLLSQDYVSDHLPVAAIFETTFL